MTKVNVQLGDEARDTVSGCPECVARTEWLNELLAHDAAAEGAGQGDGKPCEAQRRSMISSWR